MFGPLKLSIQNYSSCLWQVGIQRHKPSCWEQLEKLDKRDFPFGEKSHLEESVHGCTHQTRPHAGPQNKTQRISKDLSYRVCSLSTFRNQ